MISSGKIIKKNWKKAGTEETPKHQNDDINFTFHK